MTHLENAIGIIIASITVVFIYCGLAFDRNIGSNSQYVLNEAVNAQNQLNNNEDRTLVVVDVRGSETLQDWIN